MASERAGSWFVTGTDTGVGKTLVAAALLHALGRCHRRVVGMKPVAAGLIERDGRWLSEDVEILRGASTVVVPPSFDNPVALPEPLSPHLAAARAGRPIVIAQLVAAHRALAEVADVIVVEGAGGWRAPIGDRETMADVARAIGAPVILVVGMRLGCLNHALLTAEAIASDGLRLAGWVANGIDPAFACVEDNIAALRARLAAPLLGAFAWSEHPDPRLLAARLPDDLQ